MEVGVKYGAEKTLYTPQYNLNQMESQIILNLWQTGEKIKEGYYRGQGWNFSLNSEKNHKSGEFTFQPLDPVTLKFHFLSMNASIQPCFQGIWRNFWSNSIFGCSGGPQSDPILLDFELKNFPTKFGFTKKFINDLL